MKCWFLPKVTVFKDKNAGNKKAKGMSFDVLSTKTVCIILVLYVVLDVIERKVVFG